jgi:hypothetical protein
MGGQRPRIPARLHQDGMNSRTKETGPKPGELCSRCNKGALLTSPSGAHLVCSKCHCITVTKPPRRRFKNMGPQHLEWKAVSV